MLRRSAASRPARFSPTRLIARGVAQCPSAIVYGTMSLFANAPAAMNEYAPSRVNCVTAGQAADERVVLDRHVARELRAVDDDDVIGDLAVVADVRVGHDEVVVADARDAAAFRRADVDADELADSVVRADRERRVRAALVAQVLRRAAEHGAVLNAVARPRS